MAISVRKLTLISLLSIAITATGCVWKGPERLRVTIDGSSIAPEIIENLDFGELSYRGTAVNASGDVYVMGRDWDADGARFVYRKAPNGPWETVLELKETESAYDFHLRPSTNEVYFSTCQTLWVDGRPHDVPDSFRLFRAIRGHVVDVTEEYLGGLAPDTRSDTGITDCETGWAVMADGSLLLTSQPSLWRVRDGEAEVLISDLADLVTMPEGCQWGPMKIVIGGNYELLLHFRERLRGDARCEENALEKRPVAFRLVAGSLEPALVRDGHTYISESVISPDGSIYFGLFNDSLEENEHQYFRVEGGEEMRFTRSLNSLDYESIEGFTFDTEGNMYMFFERGGTNVSTKEWLIFFRIN